MIRIVLFHSTQSEELIYFVLLRKVLFKGLRVPDQSSTTPSLTPEVSEVAGVQPRQRHPRTAAVRTLEFQP